MTTDPKTQLTIGQLNFPAVSRTSYSGGGGGRFLPSIARKAGLSPESSKNHFPQQLHTDGCGTPQDPHQRTVGFSPGDERQRQAEGLNPVVRQQSIVDLTDRGMEASHKNRRWIYRRPSEGAGSSSPENQENQGYLQVESHSPLFHAAGQYNPSRIIFHGEETTNKKIDRIAIARRHLVFGLTGGNNFVEKGLTPGGGAGREDTRRAHSFNCHTGELSPPFASHAKVGNSLNSKKVPKGRPAVRRSSATDRAREAIDNWNSLVHQLHAEHHLEYLRQGSAHLAVLSDAGADSSGGSQRVTFDEDDHPLPAKSNPRLSRTTSLTFTDMKFPVGIGFTRYRPLTPNLLARLDKQKLPVKRRTQLWVNTIQESKRTLSKSSMLDIQLGGESGQAGTCAIREGSERAARENADGTLETETKKSGEAQLLRQFSHDFL